jgi:hypothetical protein
LRVFLGFNNFYSSKLFKIAIFLSRDRNKLD